LKIVIDPLFLRRPKLNYISPAVCEAIFSGTGSPIIVLADISKLPGPTGLVISGAGRHRFSWNAYPGALCYNVYTAVIEVHDTFECEALVAQSTTVSYRLLFECLGDPFVILPSAGCYRVSAITPDGESDLSDPACLCDFNPPPPVEVCNEEQTATCTPPLVGAPVTIAAGSFCTLANDNPADIAAAQAQMNEQALAQAESELSCSGGGGGNTAVAYYKLDEVTGQRADMVGANPLTEPAGAVGSATGIINSGADWPNEFGGEYLATASTTFFAFPASWSVSCWLRPSLSSGSCPIFQIPMCGVAGQGQGDGTMNIETFVFTPGVNFPNQFVIPAWDATVNRFRIYFNGVLTTDDIFPGAQLTDPLSLWLSHSNLGTFSDVFFGTIDEFGVWSRTLTGAEVITLYNGGAALAFGAPGFP